MHRIPYLVLFLIAFTLPASAQTNKKKNARQWQQTTSNSRSVQSFIYALSTSTDTYTDLTGATSINTGDIWDDPEYNMHIAFPFMINGNPVTDLTFYGLGDLMHAPTADPDVETYIFSFETDLIDRGSNGLNSLSPISYKVEGPAGSRIQKLEFKNAGSYYEMDELGTLDMYINFQMWLYEGSNTIEFHYGPSSISNPDLFYGGEPGPLSGTTDYNEIDEIVSNGHFLNGTAGNPFLSEDPAILSGTPTDGTVYRLFIYVPLEIIVTGENANSFCNPNGSAAVEVTGGIEPYSYLWSNGATTATIDNLDAGTYSVTVTDDEGFTETGSVTITNVIPLDLNVVSTDETGIAANDGTAEADVLGGNPPYGYAWSNGETTAFIENLSPGIYYLTVTDASSCTAEESVTINAFGCPDLTLEVAITNNACFGECSGSINIVEITQGAFPFTYNWSDGSSGPGIQNLCAGDYGVTVIDANGCIVLGEYVVTQPNELIVNAGSTNESLQNQNDGTAWAAPSGGTPPYTYEWSNGSTDSLIINLAVGTYTVTVTDDHSCTASQTITVQAGPCGIIQSQVNNPACFGDCNGSIALAFINNFPPITYSWSNGDASSMITGLCYGVYMVTVADNAGCVVIDTITVLEPELLQTFGGSDDESDIGDDGSAWVTPIGGTPPYTYLWDNGSTDSLIVNLSAGEYFVTITDANGCEAGESFVINAFTCIEGVDFDFTPISCYEGCDATLSVSLIGGVGPFSYLWASGDTTNIITDLCPGIYYVTVTDLGQDCDRSSAFIFSEPDLFYITVDEVIHFSDTTDAAIHITLHGGNTPYTTLWEGPMGYVSASEDIESIQPGFYNVVGIDANGCQFNLDSIEVLDLTVGLSPIPGWNMEIYPNPAKDKVYIKGVNVNEFQIQLVSTDGHVWKSWKNELTLDVDDLPPGYYMLRFSTGENSLVKPLMIMR
jgi:hypothetical protein